MFGRNEGVNWITNPRRVFHFRNGRTLDAGKWLPRITPAITLKIGQLFAPLNNLGRRGLVIRIAGEMTAEQLDDVGHAVAVTILFRDEFQSGRYVRRLTEFS